MRLFPKNTEEKILQFKIFSSSQKRTEHELPLRSELFNADQMEQHGKILAALHTTRKLRQAGTKDPLLARLAQNEDVLIEACHLLTTTVKESRRITPAGEWLLDNFYLIEEEVRTAKRHLPKGYSRELPRLHSGPSAALPRVYDIALEAISHGDGRIDLESLSRFVVAYQKMTPLKLGELWAIPIMLRLALIENLRRVAARIIANTIDRNKASLWADQMIEMAEKDPKSLILIIADMTRSHPPMVSAFVAELARRLQGQSSSLALPLTWIEQRLSESGLTIEQLVQSENQTQAADQVSISNSIGSLRFLGAINWRDFVESMSAVEQKLKEDPSAVYSKMDFATRDRYRHVVERVAKASHLSENDVARKAIQLAHEALKRNDDRAAHVGFYLIDNGLPELQRAAQMRFSFSQAVRKISSRCSLFLYLGAILLMTALFTGSLLAKAQSDGLYGALLALMGILLALCTSHLAVALTNWLATLLSKPKRLPRMDFSKGIPAQFRTLVVVPTMLVDAQNIENLVEALEIRFLANRDESLHFGLLTDFKDADKEILAQDDALLELAQKRIEELNKKYANGHDANDIFFLFHRPRRWNPDEQLWMGYERKRGKLAELNSLLRRDTNGGTRTGITAIPVGVTNHGFCHPERSEGSASNSERKSRSFATLRMTLPTGSDTLGQKAGYCFSLIVGKTDILSEVKYVITLDTDTELPRDSAQQFVATMAHPLNRARFDNSAEVAKSRRNPSPLIPLPEGEGNFEFSLPQGGKEKKIVIEGYGILQPRMAVSLPSTQRSRYARLYGSEFGIDPYTRAVSDVYQDVFSEGSFIGKGIYDVDAFEHALKGHFPENQILSHDLLEGCYARSGLLSDVLLYEKYPSSYQEDASRRHRWIRGDWQIAQWLLPRVPILNGSEKNPLSGLSQWKILDNLRRSLVPVALTLLLLLGWMVLPSGGLWTLSVIGILLFPALIASFLEVFQKPDDVLWSQHLIATIRTAIGRIAQGALSLLFLPYEAFLSVDAITRSTWRMRITHQRLLEWSPSCESDIKNNSGSAILAFMSSYRAMWIAPVIALATTIGILFSTPIVLGVAGPILCLWFAAPAIAWWISRPLPRREAKLTLEQTIFLQKVSRKTWSFFETFVAAPDHWLPPDNYQEHPVATIAHRTSPTNMGLALLANLSAYDFGYIQTGGLIERTTNALQTMNSLERYQGHFYNWYDTLSCQPLPPRYISSVDSGNLSGHLLTLRAGLLAIPDDPIVGARLFEGLSDTLTILVDTVADASSTPGFLAPDLAQLQKDLDSAYDSRPNTLEAVWQWLTRLTNSADEVMECFKLDNLHTTKSRHETPSPLMGEGGDGGENIGTAHFNTSTPTLTLPLQGGGNSCGLTLQGGGNSITGKGNDLQQVQWWVQSFSMQCRCALDELSFLAPWLLLPTTEPLSLGEREAYGFPLGQKYEPLSLGERGRGEGKSYLNSPSSSILFLKGEGSPFLNISKIPSLRELAQISPSLSQLDSTNVTPEEEALRINITRAKHRAQERIAILEQLALQAGQLASVEYDFLYDKARHLLTIGYNVDERRRDSSYYDLLASEARLSSFVAIAQGKLPQESWFALGRLLTTAGGKPILLSWSGSMFEYLMPLLIMPTYENTLLDQTYQAAVERQIDYGKQCSVPWGLSESGYNSVDASLNYQYRAFGVPGLGLKRGLAEDLVIAPYASVLALMVAPEEACSNLQRLAAGGLLGSFGFYEAIDYTLSRLPRGGQAGQSSVVVRSFMAHHQGMNFLSLAYLLLNRPMQKRFESDPQFKATTLLLQERIPKTTTVLHLPTSELSGERALSESPEMPVRVIKSPNTPVPEVQLLSNGRYHVMVTNAGGGYSRWKDLALTRWREDTTCDNWGTFCFIRDRESGAFWSSAYQPTIRRSETFEAIFSEARAEFRRRDSNIDTHTEVVVSPEDDIELRRLHITNRSREKRVIEVTSYAEVVLATPAADALHPAFSNLFVQTEIIRERQAILCTRRPRSQNEYSPWMFHMMVVHGAECGEISYETDRVRFIGRGRTLASPLAMSESEMLSGSEGSVLDPIVSIRYPITLEPEQSATIDMVLGISETRAACFALLSKYQDRHLADRVFDLAWTHSWVTLRQINATESDAQLYGRLASSILYANASLRASNSVLIKNRRGQSGLWSYAISGDLPIVLLQIGEAANIDLVRQLVQAHAYWRLKGLAVDMVIWNEDHNGYRQLLQEQIMGLIAAGVEAHVMDRPGGIFVRRAEQISEEDRILLQSVARVIITDKRGTLAEQVNRRGLTEINVSYLNIPRLKPTRSHYPEVAAGPTLLRYPDLLCFNGTGGFTPDGREYQITTTPTQITPLPWSNVLANPHFGTLISESGQAYTWSENAHEFRLTPWANDPVSDVSGEAFYIRDEESGHFWSPTPLPRRGVTPYVSRHGFGYSVFEHTENGMTSELTVYVALDAAIKFSVLKVRNESSASRYLSATGYVEWVLGDLRSKSAPYVITEIVATSGALFARNPYNTEFADRVVFFDVDESHRSVTGDRGEFIGRNGALNNPAAMSRMRLSGKVGAGLDPCAAIQIPFELAPGQEREIIFRLGVAGRRGADDANKLVQRFRGSTAARHALAAVKDYWTHTLGAVQIETPDLSLNLLTNGWLLYQTLACRLWARSGYYQSGGAFGFRDQLQDVMALIHAEPQLVRAHLLLCAAHQFREGDVQHWWHPPSGRGVRTRCSDDYLWLPLATCRYVVTTGDVGVLDEHIHFLEGRPVSLDTDSYYDLPNRSDESASFYQHCVRAILNGLKFGEHGLPLMGSGDWNDGMNMVGIQGRGESVWLGFFLYDVLLRFAEVARLRNDAPFSERCLSEAAQLHRNIEQHGWDGKWYRRAYFDDGSPLGSSSNSECQIDSVAQSWSVLSGAGDAKRARSAMEAVDERLVRRDDHLIQLLDPPFDKSTLNPGYIKGYVPGVRENGGQYTHGAIWAAMAFAALGDNRRAWELTHIINPLNHVQSARDIASYKGEPYVIAADVYAVSPHTGRGGWTWYTGSAGWMYRHITESLLGLIREGNKLRFASCLPAEWESFKIHYRFGETLYHITVLQNKNSGTDENNSKTNVTVDGVIQSDPTIPLINDRQEHKVEVKINTPHVSTHPTETL